MADHPGTTFTDVLRAVTLYVGATAYRLHVLERAQLVRSTKTGRHRRYWVTGQAPEGGQVAHAWGQEPHVPTLLALAAQGTTCSQAGPVLGRTRQTARWHMTRLEGAGLVESHLDGRSRIFRLRTYQRS